MLKKLVGLVVLLTTGPALAWQVVDKTNGEADKIEARKEWFRQAHSLNSVDRPDLKRRNATRETRRMRAMEANGGSQQSWSQMGPSPMTMLSWSMGNVAGRVMAIAVHPTDKNTLYLGAADGGLWKTTDGGTVWHQLFDDVGTQSIGSVTIDPNNPETIWVGTGDPIQGCTGYFGLGLFKSEDGGASFVQKNGSGGQSLDLSFIASVTFHPTNPNMILVGGHGFCDNGSYNQGGIFRSTDGGDSWTKVLSGQGWDILSFPNDPNRFIASLGDSVVASNGVYLSTDGGITWNRNETTLPFGASVARVQLSMSANNPNVLYCLMTGNLYRSTDGGDSWQLRNSNACEGQCSYNLCLDAHPDNPDEVLVGSIRFAKSTNGGTNLNYLTSGWGGAQSVHQDTHVLLYDKDNPDTFWVGSDGGIWRTDNGGSTFTNLNGNLNITQLYDIAVHPTDNARIWGGAQDNSSLMSPGTKQWDVTIVTGDGFMNLVDPTNPSIVYQTSYPSGGRPSLVKSSSGGLPGTFSFIGSSGIISGGFPFRTSIEIAADPSGSNAHIFVASNRAFMSSNGGNTWVPLSAVIATSSVTAMTALTTKDAVILYLGTSGGQILRTLNALDATPVWEDVSNDYPGGRIGDIAIDSKDPKKVYIVRAAFGESRLYVTENDGVNWQARGGSIPDVPANSVAIDPLDSTRIFVGSDVGIFESRDSGHNFTSMMSGFPLGTVVTDLEVDDEPHTMTAATFGRGAWQISLTAPFSVQAGQNQLICTDGAATLDVSTVNGTAPFTFTWSILNGPDLSNAQFSDPNTAMPVFTPNMAGEFLIQVMVEDSGSNNLTDTLQLNVGDKAEFTKAQQVAWGSNPSSPLWVDGYDRDGDLSVSVLDLLMQQASPNCF